MCSRAPAHSVQPFVDWPWSGWSVRPHALRAYFRLSTSLSHAFLWTALLPPSVPRSLPSLLPVCQPALHGPTCTPLCSWSSATNEWVPLPILPVHSSSSAAGVMINGLTMSVDTFDTGAGPVVWAWGREVFPDPNVRGCWQAVVRQACQHTHACAKCGPACTPCLAAQDRSPGCKCGCLRQRQLSYAGAACPLAARRLRVHG